MDFLFFDSTGARIFTRNDAESATHTHEEMSLQALFPYDADKIIQRGQRIGYTDALGVFQPFEIRKVRTYEPDHYQEITAEHIVISELSDEHLDQTEITNKTAVQALTALLTGTLWAVGTNTASGTQTADISRGSVWQGVRSIEENWNVYITPRVTFNASGITGRYLDIAPAQPTWRGIRLSLDKNADELGVTWDDTNVITAIYGYGGRVENATQDDTDVLTFKDVVWTATADHPAKPAGQTYLEDPAAKALYGRDGRNRFGYYQNANIDSAETLLEKSWEALKLSREPEVSIDCQVRDLYRLGYADQPMRLHDSAIIDVRPTGEKLQREIIRMTEDLLDPTATQVNIGTYIPNIVYMQRDTNRAARGGGGGGGRGGAGGQDNEIYEFETEIQANRYQINLRAYQRDMDNVDNILRQAGISIGADGVIVYADDNENMWQSRLNVQADRIGLVVEGTGANAHIKAAQIVASINAQTGQSAVLISADKITLDGQTTVDSLLTGRSAISSLLATSASVGNLSILPNGTFTINDASGFSYDRKAVTWQNTTVVTNVSITDATVNLSTSRYFLYTDSSTNRTPTGATKSSLVTSRTNGSHTVTKKVLHYLGSAATDP
jgi:phage minor structural protein